MDLFSYILQTQSECLNEKDDHPLLNCLVESDTFLLSDVDEQLIISIAFNQPVKVKSLTFKGPQENGPKHVKLFINQPKTLDFDKVENVSSVQDLELTTDDLQGKELDLKYVKFQNVQNLQIFVKSNQSGSESTQIDHLRIFGSPISCTDLSKLKKSCCAHH